jgi:5-methylcytosine-specific restriction enzyme subunit McrC
MFIENTSVDLTKNKFENITLVWDMNKLFEEFVYQLIKKEISKTQPCMQKGKRLLRKGSDTRRDTKIDILLKNPNIIIDTKYKKFTKFDDISSSDIYQVMTYCLLHGEKDKKDKKAILLYPQYNEDKPDIFGFYINNKANEENNSEKEKDYRIDFCTINLKLEDLKKSKDVIVEKLQKIIDPENKYALNKSESD